MGTQRHPALELEDVPWGDPRETIRRGKSLISSKVGLIKHIGHGVYRAQDPACFALGMAATDLSRVSPIENTSKSGGGGPTIDVALAATIGETVERYSMLFYDKESMVFGSYRDHEDDAVSPSLLRYYEPSQLATFDKSNLTYFDEDSTIYWVWGWSLTEQRPRLVPACQVYLNYGYSDGEAVVGRNASSGLAAGLTLEEAILTGVYEVVERDAFTIRWLHRKMSREIEIDDPELTALLRDSFSYEHPSVEIRAFDMTLEAGIPSAWVYMRRPSDFGPALCVGTAARLEAKAAVRKCLFEIGQELPYYRFLLHQLDDWEPREDYTDLVTFDHHCTLYVKRPDLADPALDFCQGLETVPLSSLPNRSTGRALGDIERCVELLGGAGHEVIVVDITTPDVREIGFRVVRVIVPGLVPLHGNHNRPYLGVDRLARIPTKMGWASNGWRADAGTNPFPHPFP